jgi:hypothetical protein
MQIGVRGSLNDESPSSYPSPVKGEGKIKKGEGMKKREKGARRAGED